MTSLLRSPKIYGLFGLFGFILIATPALVLFFIGFPILGEGAFNPFLLNLFIGAIIATWGCYRDAAFAWVGSLYVLAFSIFFYIFTGFNIGFPILLGAVLLLIGAILRVLDFDVK